MKNLVLTNQASDGLNINANREVWASQYEQLRRLCVVRGTRARKYDPNFPKEKQPIKWRRGRTIVDQEFWQNLKPAHKSQLSALTNKIEALHKELELS